MHITVDGKKIEIEAGTSLLQACLDNGVYIPNLCWLKDMKEPSASCRLCFVEIQGVERPVTACTVKPEDGMVVKTDAPEVRRLQRSGLQLLLSVHDVDCKNCIANKKCELQRLARFLNVGLKSKRFDLSLKNIDNHGGREYIRLYHDRCVLCGKCLHVCREIQGKPLLAFTNRGINTIVSFFGEEENESAVCVSCSACMEICPVGAIEIKPA